MFRNAVTPLFASILMGCTLSTLSVLSSPVPEQGGEGIVEDGSSMRKVASTFSKLTIGDLKLEVTSSSRLGTKSTIAILGIHGAARAGNACQERSAGCHPLSAGCCPLSMGRPQVPDNAHRDRQGYDYAGRRGS